MKNKNQAIKTIISVALLALTMGFSFTSYADNRPDGTTGERINLLNIDKAYVNLKVWRDKKLFCTINRMVDGEYITVCPIPIGEDEEGDGQHQYKIKGSIRYGDGSIKEFDFNESMLDGCYPFINGKELSSACG
jgi:hypothetical protein